MHVSDTHIRVLVTGIGAHGALAGCAAADRVDHTLASQVLLLIVIAAAGIALAAIARVARRAHRARADRAVHAPDGGDRRQPRTARARSGSRSAASDELARLARTFNTTLDALERSVESQRNLVADASHELRTPIASIRANLQLLRDEELLSAEDRAALRADMIEELDELTGTRVATSSSSRGARSRAERPARSASTRSSARRSSAHDGARPN